MEILEEVVENLRETSFGMCGEVRKSLKQVLENSV